MCRWQGFKGNYTVTHVERAENERPYESTIQLIDITHQYVGYFFCVANSTELAYDYSVHTLFERQYNVEVSGFEAIYVFVNGTNLTKELTRWRWCKFEVTLNSVFTIITRWKNTSRRTEVFRSWKNISRLPSPGHLFRVTLSIKFALMYRRIFVVLYNLLTTLPPPYDVLATNIVQ